ncbi:hypothetical protein HYY75_02520, partial [bacterium]|nr:hypothetical protein [bacterium]
SGTEPVVRYYAEAQDHSTLEKLCRYGEQFFKSQL